MPASTEPRSGLFYGWTLGETPWNEGMDANLLHIGRFGMHLSVIDRDLTAPPGSPTAGDTYIVGAGATGDWAGKDGQVAIWDGEAWAYGVPRTGWLAHIEDEQVLAVFRADEWSTEITPPAPLITSPVSVLDRDLDEPPSEPEAGDRYIVGAMATGEWTGHDEDIALWDGNAWRFYAPEIGWLAYIADEEVLSAYKAGGWSAGAAI